MALKDGINNLPLSFIGRHILDNLITRLVKGDPDGYLVTFREIADGFQVDREDVDAAILDLRANSIIILTGPSHAPLIGLRLKHILIMAEPVTLGGSDVQQPTLADTLDQQRRMPSTRPTGFDQVTVDGRTINPVVSATDEGFELTIMRCGAVDGGEDPKAPPEMVVDRMPFGSAQEAWDWFDNWAGAPRDPELPAGAAIWTASTGEEVPDWSIKYDPTEKDPEGYPMLYIEIMGGERGWGMNLGAEGAVEFFATDIVRWAREGLDKPEEFAMEDFEHDVREALAYALAQSATPPEPSPDPLTDGDSPPEGKKRGRRKKAAPAE